MKLLEIIVSSKEWQGFGFNSLTISFIGTIFFTLLQAWGLWSQHKTITKNKSGGAVSIGLFSYSTFSTITFFCYGLLTHGFAVIFNGLLLGFLYLIVLLDLVKFKKFTLSEKLITFGSFLFIPSIIFLPWKDAVLTLGMVISMFPLAMQPFEMWRKKSSLSVEIKFFGASALSNIFWFVYGISIGSLPLSIMNPISLIILSTTSYLWYKYRDPDKK